MARDTITPRKALIHAVCDRLITMRDEAIAGYRHLDANDAKDALRIEEAIECEEGHVEGATQYLDGLSHYAWRRLLHAVAGETNRRLDVRWRGGEARQRQRTRKQRAA